MKMMMLALIFGFITYNTPDGMPAEDITVELHTWNCSANEPLDTSITNADGLYVFYDVDPTEMYFIYPQLPEEENLEYDPIATIVKKKDVEILTLWVEEFGFINMDVDLDGHDHDHNGKDCKGKYKKYCEK